MTGRTRKTPEQMIAGLERKLQLAKSRKKNLEQAQRTRRAVILGTTIQAMADSGDADAKAAMAKVMAGLTRKQDREAFGLPLLQEPAPVADPAAQPAASPPGADPLAAAVGRRTEALKAWDFVKTEANRIAVGQAIAACEALSGECWDRLPLEQRPGWGLGDRPGELLQAS